MSLNGERLKKRLMNGDYRFTERTEIANEWSFKKRILHNIASDGEEGKDLALVLETPLAYMNKDYRDAYYELFSSNGEIPIENKAYLHGKFNVYDVGLLGIRLIDIIYKCLVKDNDNLDSDSFDITPYFSIINNTEIIAGFMTFERDPDDDHSIIEIGLFSFDPKNKQFGKQVWEDFDECIIDYLGRGYKIKFSANKTNRACKHYEELINNFKGYKEDKGNYWEYYLGYN